MMQPYSAEHWAALAATVVVTVVLLSYARRNGDGTYVTIAGWTLLVVSLVWTCWDMQPALFDIHRSLPFHLSDLTRVLASLALITRSWWFLAPSYYWGLTLNTQSIITPDLSYAFHPVSEYFMYWGLHIAVFAVPLVMVFSLGHRPRWRWLRATAWWSAGWMGATMAFNAATNSNYGYLNGLPPIPSALDYLGPWPWYLLVGIGLLGTVWAGVMTWPFERRSRSAQLQSA